MTAHASNFVPDTPTVAGALAWERGTEFVFHPVNRLDKGTTGLMVVAKSGYVHDLLRAQPAYSKILPGVPGNLHGMPAASARHSGRADRP